MTNVKKSFHYEWVEWQTREYACALDELRGDDDPAETPLTNPRLSDSVWREGSYPTKKELHEHGFSVL